MYKNEHGRHKKAIKAAVIVNAVSMKSQIARHRSGLVAYRSRAHAQRNNRAQPMFLVRWFSAVRL
jgi:hypothetical protein